MSAIPPTQPMQTPDPNDLSTILSPLFSLFSLPQVESLLYVYLPTRIEKYVHKTGLYAVDTFVVTASVTLVLVLVKLFMKALQSLRHSKKKTPKSSDSLEISVIIEPTHVDDYHSSKVENAKEIMFQLLTISYQHQIFTTWHSHI